MEPQKKKLCYNNELYYINSRDEYFDSINKEGTCKKNKKGYIYDFSFKNETTQLINFVFINNTRIDIYKICDVIKCDKIHTCFRENIMNCMNCDCEEEQIGTNLDEISKTNFKFIRKYKHTCYILSIEHSFETSKLGLPIYNHVRCIFNSQNILMYLYPNKNIVLYNYTYNIYIRFIVNNILQFDSYCPIYGEGLYDIENILYDSNSNTLYEMQNNILNYKNSSHRSIAGDRVYVSNVRKILSEGINLASLVLANKKINTQPKLTADIFAKIRYDYFNFADGDNVITYYDETPI